MKHPSNYTFEEFQKMYEDVPLEKIQIVYDYYHRDKTYTIDRFVINKHISKSTLYRYLQDIENYKKSH